MAGFPAPPSSAFADVTLDINRIPPGEIWRRMYETRFTDPLGWAPALSRFSDPTGHAFGVVYLGATAKVAFVGDMVGLRARHRDILPRSFVAISKSGEASVRASIGALSR